MPSKESPNIICKMCNDAGETKGDLFIFPRNDEGKAAIERHFIEKHPEHYRKFLEDRHPELLEAWDKYINGR